MLYAILVSWSGKSSPTRYLCLPCQRVRPTKPRCLSFPLHFLNIDSLQKPPSLPSLYRKQALYRNSGACREAGGPPTQNKPSSRMIVLLPPFDGHRHSRFCPGYYPFSYPRLSDSSPGTPRPDPATVTCS